MRPSELELTSANLSILDAYNIALPNHTRVAVISQTPFSTVMSLCNSGSKDSCVLKFYLMNDDKHLDDKKKFILMKNECEILRKLTPAENTESHYRYIVAQQYFIEINRPSANLIGYVMPRYSGTLMDLITMKGAIGNQIVFRACYNLLDALSYLREQNIVHRDIKPGNIFITSNNEAILGDFNLALRLNPGEMIRITDSSGAVATKAPEALLYNLSSNASDLHSLWATLLMAMLGKKNLYALLHQQMKGNVVEKHKETMRDHDEPYRLIDHFDRFSVHLRLLTSHAMHKNPAQRLAPMDLRARLVICGQMNNRLFALQEPTMPGNHPPAPKRSPTNFFS